MKNFFKLFIGIVVTLAILGLGSILFESYLSETEIEVKVINKEKIFDEEGNVHYFIYTKEEVFRNENNKYHGKINADDLYTRIRKGRQYTFKVVGYSFREYMPFMHENRNIIDLVDVKDKTRKLKDY